MLRPFALLSVLLLHPEVLPAMETVLTLRAALPGERDLLVHVADDGRAFAVAPTYNRAPIAVTLSDWQHAGGPRGEVAVTIPSDGWVPKPGTMLTARYRVDGDRYEGDTDGVAVGGTVTAAVWADDVRQGSWRCSLQLANALDQGQGKPGQRRLGCEITLVDGVAATCRAVPRGSPTDTALACRTIAQDLAIVDGHLRGSMRFGLRRQGAMQQEEEIAYLVDLPVVGGRLAGHLRLADVVGAEPVPALGHCWAVALADPGDACATLVLAGAVAEHNYLRLRLRLREGAVAHAIVTSPNWNNAVHELVASDLRLADGRLRGGLQVRLQPDPWVPSDGLPRLGDYDIDAMIHGAGISGEMDGRWDGEPCAGQVLGELDAQPVIPLAAVEHLTLKLEDALSGGTRWHNRAFVRVDMEDGVVTGGRVSNNHTSLRGTVTGGSVTVDPDGERWRVEVALQVDAAGETRAGSYGFEVDLQRVGRDLAGRFSGGPAATPDTRKTGTCWGAIRLRD